MISFISRFADGRTAGCEAAPRIAVALFAALFGLQAVAQTPPLDLPNRGVLRLQLGTTVTDGGLHTPKRFVHEPSGLSQSIGLSGKCGLFLGGPSSLAVLTPAGGSGTLGLGNDSIGVYDGSKGVACYRITASIGESVKFGLGPDVAPLIDANAFYRLELDVEVKSNAELLLEIWAGDTVTDQYWLRSGSSIRAGEGSTSPGSVDHIYNCTAQSDSGPDAGARDNCRWVVDALGEEFRIVPLAGEASLEGGGDFGAAAYVNDTLVYLTEGDIGALGCNSSQVPQGTSTSTVGDGLNDAQCSITRIDPTDLGGSCTQPVGYVLRSIAGVQEGCEINKAPSEQLAASVDLIFPPEASTAIGSEPLTLIEFSTDVAGVTVPFTPQRCIGTVVADRNGEPTILEVLSVPGFVPDIVPATPQKDWACVLNSAADYIGSGQMQIRQTILFWGDISFSRQ